MTIIILSALLAVCVIVISMLIFKVMDLKNEVEYQRTLFKAYSKEYSKLAGFKESVLKILKERGLI